MCSIPECGGAVRTKGYCSKHYTRFWKYGDPYRVYVRKPTLQCVNGHPYTEKTTYVNPRGRKICRICKYKKGSTRRVN